MSWSRRRLLQLCSLSALVGFPGCTSLPFVGSLGFRLRNYTGEAHDARVEIQFAGQTAFEQTYQLSSANGTDPYVHTEANAVSGIPNGMSYTVTLFLDGTEIRTLKATMDCTDRDSQQMDEEIDISIGFGGGDSVHMADTQC